MRKRWWIVKLLFCLQSAVALSMFAWFCFAVGLSGWEPAKDRAWLLLGTFHCLACWWKCALWTADYGIEMEDEEYNLRGLFRDEDGNLWIDTTGDR